MKHLILWIFGCVTIGVLFAMGHYLLKEHKKMYGACWKKIVSAANDLANFTIERKLHTDRYDEIITSTDHVKNFIAAYDGYNDLDIAFAMINPEWEFFKLLRIKLRNSTKYIYPLYMEFLEQAIFLYNTDKEYTITTRQLIAYTNYIFDEYYVTEIKKHVK